MENSTSKNSLFDVPNLSGRSAKIPVTSWVKDLSKAEMKALRKRRLKIENPDLAVRRFKLAVAGLGILAGISLMAFAAFWPSLFGEALKSDGATILFTCIPFAIVFGIPYFFINLRRFSRWNYRSEAFDSSGALQELQSKLGIENSPLFIKSSVALDLLFLNDSRGTPDYRDVWYHETQGQDEDVDKTLAIHYRLSYDASTDELQIEVLDHTLKVSRTFKP